MIKSMEAAIPRQNRQKGKGSMKSKNQSDAPSSLACITCRRRHLKCDARMPVCTRCQASQTECRYVQSRRGLRPRDTNRSIDVVASSMTPPQEVVVDDSLLLATPGIDTCIGADFPDWLQAGLEVPGLPNIDATALDLTNNNSAARTEQQTLGPVACEPESPNFSNPAYDFLIQLYYQNFHSSHPFILPHKALQTHIGRHLPGHLLTMMRCIGAHYHYDTALRDVLRDTVDAELLSQSSSSKAGFRVQTMLLMTITDHAHGFEEEAGQTLRAAVNLALEIRMHCPSFARENSCGSAVLEESWRRTYWELYVVDGFCEALRNQNTFALYSVDTRLSLPCSEETYNRMTHISTQPALADLKQGWRDEKQFSSYAYRIEAVHILSMVLALHHSLDAMDDIAAEAIDASLAAFFMHLPAARRETYGSDGRVDEMMLQAQMIAYLGIIYLHHPQSNLKLGSFRARTSCTRLPANSSSLSDPAACTVAAVQEKLDIHSRKVLRAADMLSNLAALPSPVKRRSPFLICAFAISVIIHIASSLTLASPPSSQKEEEEEERITARMQLGIGALKMLGEIWPLSKMVKEQLLDVYREVFPQYR